MSKLDEIKAALAEIRWPWSKGDFNGEQRAFDSQGVPICTDEITGALVKEGPRNFAFIAAAPERLAALVEFAEAADKRDRLHAWTIPATCICAACENYQAARRALGLEIRNA